MLGINSKDTATFPTPSDRFNSKRMATGLKCCCASLFFGRLNVKTREGRAGRRESAVSEKGEPVQVRV